MKKSRRWSLEPIKIRELASGFQAIKELAFGIHTDQGVGARHLEAYARHCRGKSGFTIPLYQAFKICCGLRASLLQMVPALHNPESDGKQLNVVSE